MKTPARHVLAVCGMVTASLLVASSATAQSSTRASSRTFRNDTAFAVNQNGVIDITVTNGNLIVRGSDRSTAELRADSRNFNVRSSGVSVALSVGNDGDRRNDRGSDRRRGDDDDIELLVPRAVRLVIHCATGDVSVSDVTGDVEVHGRSGDIHTRALGGRAILETLTGDIRVTDGVGDLRVTTVSGDLTANGIRGAIDILSTSGSVVLLGDRIVRAQIEAVSGDISFDGAIGPNARVQLTTHSGDVSLRIPESSGGVLEVSSFSGSISGGAMTLMPSSGRNSRSRIGDGGTKQFEFGGGGNSRITVSTFSGDVTLRRAARRGSEE